MTWSLDARLLVRRIDAGFPSPAEEWRELELNVHQLLVPRPASTFFFCVSGSSMQGAGIHDGDLLIVDRMLTAGHHSMADGQFGGLFGYLLRSHFEKYREKL